MIYAWGLITMQVSEKPKTVCVECWWIVVRPSAPSCCEKSQEVLGYDTVTGEAELAGLSLCAGKNDGNCPDFEAKAPETTQQ